MEYHKRLALRIHHLRRAKPLLERLGLRLVGGAGAAEPAHGRLDAHTAPRAARRTLHKPARRQDEISDQLCVRQRQALKTGHVLAQPGADGGNGALHKPDFGRGLRHLGQHFLGRCQLVQVVQAVQAVLLDLGGHSGFAHGHDLLQDGFQRPAKGIAQAVVAQHLMEQDARRVARCFQLSGQQVGRAPVIEALGRACGAAAALLRVLLADALGDALVLHVVGHHHLRAIGPAPADGAGGVLHRLHGLRAGGRACGWGAGGAAAETHVAALGGSVRARRALQIHQGLAGKQRLQHRHAVLAHRHKIPIGPLDALMQHAHAGQLARRRRCQVARFQFNAQVAGHAGALQLPAVGQLSRVALEDAGHHFVRGQLGRGRGNVQALADFGNALLGDHHPQQALAVLGLRARHLDGAAGFQAVPNWQHGTHDHVRGFAVGLGPLGALGFPYFARFGFGGCAVRHNPCSGNCKLGRILELRAAGALQAVAVHHGAVLERGLARPDLRPHPPAFGVHHPLNALLARRKFVVDGRVRQLQLHQTRFRTGARVGIGHFVAGHGRFERADGLHAAVELAALHGHIHLFLHALDEGVKHLVLHVQAQRQHAVQKQARRGHLVIGNLPLLVHDALQPGLAQEVLKVQARHSPALGVLDQLHHGLRRVFRFQVVFFAEHALVGCVALALGQCAQLVQPAGNGRQKALLRRNVGAGQEVVRGRSLVGAVCAAKALHRLVGAPAGLNQVVLAFPLVGLAQVGME